MKAIICLICRTRRKIPMTWGGFVTRNFKMYTISSWRLWELIAICHPFSQHFKLCCDYTPCDSGKEHPPSFHFKTPDPNIHVKLISAYTSVSFSSKVSINVCVQTMAHSLVLPRDHMTVMWSDFLKKKKKKKKKNQACLIAKFRTIKLVLQTCFTNNSRKHPMSGCLCCCCFFLFFLIYANLLRQSQCHHPGHTHFRLTFALLEQFLF